MSHDPFASYDPDADTPTDFEAQKPPLDHPPDRRPERPLPAVVAAVHVPLPRASPSLRHSAYSGGDGADEPKSGVFNARTGRTRQMVIWGSIIVGMAHLFGVIGKCSAPLVDAVAERIRPAAQQPEAKPR